MQKKLRNIFLIVLFFTLIFNQKKILEADLLQQAEIDKARLEQELIKLEEEIAKKQKELEAQKGQSSTLTNEITKLNTQINRSKLDIQAKNLVIKKLGGEINEKNKQIESLEDKVNRERKSLAQLIRKEKQINDKNILVLLLSKDSISNVYSDINSFSLIKQGIKDSMDVIRGIKNETEIQKQTLEQKKNQELDTKAELEDVKRKVELSEAEKKKLLSISKDKEVEYQKIIAERKAEAVKIRARLFELAGGMQGGGIPFGDAVKYAEYASTKTGVRTAFILGILKQETNIGKNVGLCTLANKETGESKGVNTGTIFKNGMSPSRDIPPFLKITEQLGIDPLSTRISCPISGAGGWGGAMGPSQFIPSTWMMFTSRIAKEMNVTVSNPWNPEHAIMATALYLKDLGGVGGNYSAERNAACKYYSGRPCDSPYVKNAFYGNSVMSYATKMAEEIAFIKEN